MGTTRIVNSGSDQEFNSTEVVGFEVDGERLYGGVIDVREFRATAAGGLTPGQRANMIQDAIDAAASRTCIPAVRIPAAADDTAVDSWVLGRQDATASDSTPVYALDLKDGVDIIGDGRTATKLELTGENHGSAAMALVRGLDVSDIRLANMTLDGNKAAASGTGAIRNLFLSATATTGGVDNILCENLDIINSEDDGVAIAGGNASGLVTNVVFRNCRFNANTTVAADVARYSQLIRFVGCHFETKGLTLDDVVQCELIDCDLVGNEGTPANTGIIVLSTNNETSDFRMLLCRVRGWTLGTLLGATTTTIDGVDLDKCVYRNCTTGITVAVDNAGELGNVRLGRQLFNTVTTEFSGAAAVPVGQQVVLMKEHAANSDNGTETHRVAKLHRRMIVEAVRYVNPTGLAAHASNYATFSLKNDSTTVASFDTDTNGDNITLAANGYQDATLSGTAADLLVEVDEVLDWEVAETGTTTVPAGRVEVYGRYIS